MKKYIIPISIVLVVIIAVVIFAASKNNTETETTTTTPTTTEKAPGKYANSKYLGQWYNADADQALICTLNDDGTAVFKNDKKATWAETASGITITATVDGAATTMEGYFVIAGDGFVARATETNMHYLNEGGTLQLEIMLTESTCVDCVKK